MNPQELQYIFYEMNLLLEHQNGKFKQFQTDQGLLLQKSDQLFKLYALILNAL